MVILIKALLISIVALVSFSSYSQVSNVDVICPGQTKCLEFTEKVKSLVLNKGTRSDIEKALEFVLLDSSIEKLSYEIYEQKDESWLVKIFATPKQRISDISYLVDSQEVDISSVANLVPLKINGFYEEEALVESKRLIRDQLIDRGYRKAIVNVSTQQTDSGLDLTFKIDAGKGIRVSQIKIITDYDSSRTDILNEFETILDSTWNSNQTRQTVENMEKSYFERGFWSNDINAELIESSTANTLEVRANLGRQYLFQFKDNESVSRSELINNIKLASRGISYQQMKETIKRAIKQSYDSLGLYDVETKITEYLSTDKKGINRVEFYVDVTENIKTPLGDVIVEGSQFFDKEFFDKLLQKKCSVLVCRGYFDRNFFNEFSSELRTNYLKNGFVMATISSPELKKEVNSKMVVRYTAIENQRVDLTKVDFPGLPESLKLEIVKKLKSKVGQPLDVTVIEEDMNTALNHLREAGYFFARITQLRENKIVQYGRSLQTAQLIIPFELGRKTYFDGILVSGNIDTKTQVIERENDLKKGDLVTSKDVNRLRDRLTALGLFSNVTITPFLTQSSKEDQYWLSLLVEVQERNFGLGEVAPGYRTDLGPKASFQLSYNNLQGLNRTVSLRLQSNIRLDTSEFDARRNAENHRRPEFSTELSFREPWLFPYLLGSKWDFEFTTSFRRQRFFSFDADIFRIGPRLTKQFGDHVTASVKYQFEDIKQFDATEARDGDRFQIGGITPSISLDYRDSPIIPTKGSFFSLSWEFANPYFASQKKENLEINFNKLTSRNRFYYPVGNLVFALSISGGLQKNFADDLQRDANGNVLLNSDGTPLTVGYIPSIKVFRLDGIDNVRGFGDDEINRLPLGIDIGELRIQDTVSYINYKFEPRYYFSDLVALGVFFDAAGLYVNSFSPLQVRTAVGLSAKLVTPVGSLDFDYGVKLHRQRYASGQRESFGRFHLSIGSF